MKPGPGSLLIAPPAMTDTRFAKTVLLVTHNNDAGTFALCLNKPTRHTLEPLSKELKLDIDLPFQIHWGGPVHNGSIWMMHDDSWEIEHTMYVDEKWRVTSHESMFHHMADSDIPREFRIVSGFASWMPGQLNMELNGVAPFSKSNSWLVVNKVTPEWVFETAIDELWDDSVALAGSQAVESWF
jgi:putative transcriptional regulator